jgi:hypothetical protein
MVQHLTDGIAAAQARTGIRAFGALACPVRRAVRIDRALRPACNVRVAKVFGNALACCSPVPVGADGIFAAG